MYPKIFERDQKLFEHGQKIFELADGTGRIFKKIANFIFGQFP